MVPQATSDPLLAGQYGKAAFEVAGPLLLISWAEVGPGLLQAMSVTCGALAVQSRDGIADLPVDEPPGPKDPPTLSMTACWSEPDRKDVHHWGRYRRPISAETLRKRLGVGAARSRLLVSTIRSERAWWARCAPFRLADLRSLAGLVLSAGCDTPNG